MNTTTLLSFATLSVALLLGGCHKSHDLKSVCIKLCHKSVTCAPEVAKASGMPEKLANTATASAKKALPACIESCGVSASKATAKDKAQVPVIDACLSKSCTGFSKCMDAIK